MTSGNTTPGAGLRLRNVTSNRARNKAQEHYTMATALEVAQWMAEKLEKEGVLLHEDIAKRSTAVLGLGLSIRPSAASFPSPVLFGDTFSG